MTSAPPPPVRPPHRLVLCLDGTWNDRDDCTNVYHLSNLVREGEVGSGPERAKQLVHYQQGVGTGPLDRLTGGGFGFGLEKNVREAYDWLIENYHDGDQIYVFGFSRGAYTARSLVGLIWTCGLLARGAPITVNQLWRGHCILGRQREQRESWWDPLGRALAPLGELLGVHPGPPPFRALHELAFDDGLRKVQVLTSTEELLLRFARRVPIRFLGVFDTVGAVGWDALAIPGLRSRLALQHNMRASKRVELCYHALALDEHRSSFSHTAFHQFRPGTEAKWQQEQKDWDERLQQRWFAGAHSSVGGGYDDNVAALFPLRWMMSGAEKQGLQFEPLPPARPSAQAALPALPDSFARFAPPLWEHLLRSKRSYRPVAPPADVRYSKKRREAYVLRSIGEVVDESVRERLGADVPPSLVAHAREAEARGGAGFGSLAELEPRCVHRWLGEEKRGYLYLALWATLAASGTLTLARFFALEIPSSVFAFLAVLAVVIDWGESRLGFSLATRPGRPLARALLDMLFWPRAVAVLAFFAGSFVLTAEILAEGWSARTPREFFTPSWLSDWPIPLAACAAVVLLGGLDARGPRSSRALMALAAAPLLALGAWSAMCLTALAAAIFQAQGAAAGALVAPPPGAEFAGKLLLLELAAVALARGLDWVGKPLAEAGLGSIVCLQLKPLTTLERWCARLGLAQGEDSEVGRAPAVRRVGRVVREALWRDNFGFIPLYSLVFACAAWVGAPLLESWLQRPLLPDTLLYTCIAWVVLTALIDYLENLCHLRLVCALEQARPPSVPLARLGQLASLVKFIGFAGGLGLLGTVLGHAAWQVATGAVGGWRAQLALTGALALVVVLPAWMASVTLAAWWERRDRKACANEVRPRN